jgi:MFS transporter, ACS family, hexuronate transporter
MVDTLNSPAVSKGRWVMLAFAFVATVINYLDRQTLSVLPPVLLERFKISATINSHIIFALYAGRYGHEWR